RLDSRPCYNGMLMRSAGAVLFLFSLAWGAGAHGQEMARDRTDTLTVEECAALARHRAPAVVAADLARQAAVFESNALARNHRPEVAFVGRALVAPKG